MVNLRIDYRGKDSIGENTNCKRKKKKSFIISRKKEIMSSKSKGFLFGILAALFFALLNVIVKAYGTQFPAAEILFARSVVGITFFTPFVFKNIRLLLNKKYYLAWIRFFTGALAVYAVFYNTQLNGASFAIVMSTLGETLFIVLFSIVFFKERLLKREWTAIIIVLAGASILRSPFGIAITLLGVFIAIGGALSGSIAMISLKKAVALLSPALIVWGFCFVCGLVAPLLPSERWACSSLSQLGLLALTGFLGAFGQFFVTKSYAELPAIIAAVITLSAILWTIMLESLYFRQMPSGVALLSYGLIFVGLNLLQIFNKSKGLVKIP
jgi:drug/metabolite transporter (DMT)-like permease